MLEHFSSLLFSKIKLCSMTLYDACLAFVALETEEMEIFLTHLYNDVEAIKQHNQVIFHVCHHVKK